MAATRVRVLFEFRNGDGNFLQLEKSGTFTPCKGPNDIEALEQAYIQALTEHGDRLETLKQMLALRKPPGHD